MVSEWDGASVVGRTMSGHDAMALMKMAVDCLDTKHGRIVLDETMSIMDGTTEDQIYFVTHRVGVMNWMIRGRK